MTWLAGIFLIAVLIGVVVLMVAVFRHGHRETAAAEEMMDEITLALLRSKRKKDDGKNEG